MTLPYPHRENAFAADSISAARVRALRCACDRRPSTGSSIDTCMYVCYIIGAGKDRNEAARHRTHHPTVADQRDRAGVPFGRRVGPAHPRYRRRLPPPTLRDRLEADVKDRPAATAPAPFSTLYQTDDEWAAEIVNRTVHGVLHLSCVQTPSGEYRGQMAVLVKPTR